jgi:Fibronectin type III domain
MVDYLKSTGNSGTMLIRDTGFTIEFWLNSNNSTTWNAALPWSMIINGVSSGNLYYNYQPNAGWRQLAVQVITYSQTVQFKLGATGTSGFGGPTTFNQWINRASVPPAPTTPTLSEITASSMKTVFHSQGEGVGTFLRWELGYGTNSSSPTTIVTSSGTLTVTGLSSGTTYYFWARGVNSTGTGPWSGRASASTTGAPGVNSPPTVTNVTQVSASLKVNSGGDGGSPMNLIQYGWTTNASDLPVTNVYSVMPTGGMPPTTITGLPPGTTLYFRSRTRNAVGWSPWSGATVTRTIAGGMVKVGPVWKEAVPYVKVAGVWRVARPWAKIAGVWKETR